MHLSINMSSVEDSAENYQSYLVACFAVMVFESYEIHFFSCFVIRISISLNAQICIHSRFYTSHTSLGCRKCLIHVGMLFDRKPD